MFDTVARSAATAPDPSTVDDAELVELIRAWERLACWAAAGQLAAIAELARRRPRDLMERPAGPTGPLSVDLSDAPGDAGHPGLPEVSEFAVDEVAAALRLSRPAAGIRLHTAVELTRLPAAAAALRSGVLDLPKVRAVVDSVSVLDGPTAAAVEARVLPRAERQTVGQLRASLSRAVLSVDPQAAEVRHQRALDDRQVTVRPLRDGMAELWALLPADSAMAVYSCVDRLARSAPADDSRGMDARRADALVATVLAHPSAATATVRQLRPAAAKGAGVPGSVVPGAVVPGSVAIGSAVPGSVVPGAVVPSSAVPGSASATAATAPAASGVAASGVAASGVAASAGRAPSADRPASAGVPAGVGTAADAAGAVGWDGVVGGRWAASPTVVATVHVTVPAATALGVGAEPGELAGYGPVPASMAGRLAGTGAWRKVTTDPVSGAVVDVGRRPYTPPAALAELIRARDRTCRFPGCRQPARRCDLDHVVRWPDGPTDAANLAALCRHHHRLKHRTQWTVHAGPGGDLVWTAPSGHSYVTSPAS